MCFTNSIGGDIGYGDTPHRAYFEWVRRYTRMRYR